MVVDRLLPIHPQYSVVPIAALPIRVSFGDTFLSSLRTRQSSIAGDGELESFKFRYESQSSGTMGIRVSRTKVVSDKYSVFSVRYKMPYSLMNDYSWEERSCRQFLLRAACSRPRTVSKPEVSSIHNRYPRLVPPTRPLTLMMAVCGGTEREGDVRCRNGT